jgi:PAS domain S-box-containing protein
MNTNTSHFIRPSLRFRLFIFFSAVVAVFSIFLYFYLSRQFEEQILSAEQYKAINVAEFSAASISLPLRQNDSAGVQAIITSLRQHYLVLYVVVLDQQGKRIAGYLTDTAETYQYREAAARNLVDLDRAVITTGTSITADGNVIGSMYIGFSLQQALQALAVQRTELAWISIIRLLFGSFLVFILTTIVLRPINSMMTRFMTAVHTDIFHRMQPTGYEEIDRFVRSFNTMVADLEVMQNELHSVNRTLELRVNERTSELQKEIQQHKATEAALRESEERYRALVELSPDAIVVHSEQSFTFINPSALSMFRVYSAERMNGRSLYDFMHPAQAHVLQESLLKILQGSLLNVSTEFSFIREDGGEFIAEVAATRLIYRGRVAIQIVIRDISDRMKNERKRIELEQQLLHVQKKEIISTLASGLAHDILNILGIIGTSINKLLFMKNLTQDSLMESADQIAKASERGKSLVRQLLSFARKSELNFDSVNINTIVTEITSVIQRTFPATIAVKNDLSPDLPPIRADNNQLHQALLNLCLNARDAIQETGLITISTTAAIQPSVAAASASHHEYICVCVSDDGVGMPEEVIARIYEPFFTTKSEGTGSGLGMAMVKGIMENHRGYIEIDSAVGKGTTFRLFFPV